MVFTILCLAAGLAWTQGAGTGQRVAASGAEARAAVIRGFGARPEGSRAEAAAFDYIEAELRRMGLEPQSADFSDALEDYSRSRIVEASMPGERADELAVIVPVGSWSGSAEDGDGAYGIALALDAAARLSAARKEGKLLPVSLRFVFLGAEKRGRRADGAIAALGSRTWIRRQEGRGSLAALYLNLPGPPSRVELRGAGRSVLAPYWYYEGMRRALDASGMDYGIDANRQEAYRLGLARDYGPAAPYLEAGMPAVELRPAAPRAGSPDADWFYRLVSDFAKASSGGFSESWDRHYFILQAGRNVAVVPEKAFVAMLVGLTALVTLSILAATVARRKAVKRLLKRGPAFAAELLALFGALVAVVFVGRELSGLEAFLLGSPRAWTLLPQVFAVSRALFCFLLFLSLLSFLVGKRILTPNPYYYEFAGLVCLAIDVIVFSVVDLSAAFYFIWALVVVEVSLAIRRKWATLAAYLVMYLPLLVIAWEMLRRPDMDAYGRLISPDYVGLLSFAALALPFFAFTASPLLFFERSGAGARKKEALVLAALALAAELAAAACFAAVVPADGPRRSDLRVSETIDQDRGEFRLRLDGSRRLGKGRLIRGSEELPYDEAGGSAEIAGEDRRRRVEIEESSRPFLDRADESIRLRFASAPYSLELGLDSDAEMLVYDCSLPYKVAVDGKSATIYAGVNPGADFSFSITVPDSFRSRLTVKARYLAPLEGCAQSSGSGLSFGDATLTASRMIGKGAEGRGGSEGAGGSGGSEGPQG